MSSATISKNRQKFIQMLQQRYGGCWLLKGANTLITNGKQNAYSSYGTPALATAGSGDVLSGMLGALLAQGVDCFDAAGVAVCMHAQSGERAEILLGTRSVIASDIIKQLPTLWKEMQDYFA